MHVQVVTFGLNGITEEQYHQGCQDEAEAFAKLPGLLAKVWTRNPDENTYGAVYLWRDRESCEQYVKGEIFESIKNDETLSNVTSKDFDVFEDLTKVTQPGLPIV
jgi:hypothetical protein